MHARQHAISPLHAQLPNCDLRHNFGCSLSIIGENQYQVSNSEELNAENFESLHSMKIQVSVKDLDAQIYKIPTENYAFENQSPKMLEYSVRGFVSEVISGFLSLKSNWN